MFSLIRRISYGVIPRPDRPWEDDPTSNAPNTRRKRRLSSTERDADGDEEQAKKKKVRGESATPSVADAAGMSNVTEYRAETPAVKEVTKGVEEVALDGNLDGKDEEKPASVDFVAPPESVPLPEERSGELDEPTHDVTLEVAPVDAAPTPADDAEESSSNAGTDVASSADEDSMLPEDTKKADGHTFDDERSETIQDPLEPCTTED